MHPKEQARALQHIEHLALLGNEAREPLVKSLGDKLFELRWHDRNRQYRIAYFSVRNRKFLLLHGFVKKTRTTPDRELEIARQRMRDYLRRHKE